MPAGLTKLVPYDDSSEESDSEVQTPDSLLSKKDRGMFSCYIIIIIIINLLPHTATEHLVSTVCSSEESDSEVQTHDSLLSKKDCGMFSCYIIIIIIINLLPHTATEHLVSTVCSSEESDSEVQTHDSLLSKKDRGMFSRYIIIIINIIINLLPHTATEHLVSTFVNSQAIIRPIEKG